MMYSTVSHWHPFTEWPVSASAPSQKDGPGAGAMLLPETASVSIEATPMILHGPWGFRRVPEHLGGVSQTWILLHPAGWWLTYPSEKYESRLRWWFPIYGKISFMFQTTNHHGFQMLSVPSHGPRWFKGGTASRRRASADTWFWSRMDHWIMMILCWLEVECIRCFLRTIDSIYIYII